MSRTDSTAAERRVQEAIDRMHEARAEFRRAMELNAVGHNIHSQFQQAILDVYDELRPYREQLPDQWTDAAPYEDGLDALPRIIGSRETVEEVSCYGGVIEQSSVERPRRIDQRTLLEISYNLDEIAATAGLLIEVEGVEEFEQRYADLAPQIDEHEPAQSDQE